MKTKYTSISLYATQGGGVAVKSGHGYVFHEVPSWGTYKKGDDVPEEWGVHYMRELYTMVPKETKDLRSRNRREGTSATRNDYFNKRRTLRRVQVKKARLALKGTMRSVSRSRIAAVDHWVGVIMAQQERREARKLGKLVDFHQRDLLKAVNVDDCEEGLRLGDICVMDDRTSAHRDFIIVTIRRNGKKKQLEKSRFVLHSRFVEDE